MLYLDQNGLYLRAEFSGSLHKSIVLIKTFSFFLSFPGQSVLNPLYL